MNCNLCPRKCNTDRSRYVGFCKSGEKIKVARASLHMWEEPCISGEEGSGTIFFSGCNMGCVYCQNRKISLGQTGKEISADRLSELMLELEERKANNINLVTPSHYTSQITEAIDKARQKGLSIPIVYNTSAYETAEQISSLEGYVDVYLPDFKYFDNSLAKKYSNAEDYKETATLAIDEMVRQCGSQSFNERGIMTKGVIVRHLLLPGYVKDSKNVIRYLHDRYADRIYISIMNQFTPLENVRDYKELNRKVTKREYDELVDYAIDIGVEKGFIQEGDTASESFIPEFELMGL